MTASITLATLCATAAAAEAAFETVLRDYYPRADRWTFYRAAEALSDGTADTWDWEMASNPAIVAAHAEYVRAIHAFYVARDGAAGVLGRLAPAN